MLREFRINKNSEKRDDVTVVTMHGRVISRMESRVPVRRIRPAIRVVVGGTSTDSGSRRIIPNTRPEPEEGLESYRRISPPDRRGSEWSECSGLVVARPQTVTVPPPCCTSHGHRTEEILSRNRHESTQTRPDGTTALPAFLDRMSPEDQCPNIRMQASCKMTRQEGLAVVHGRSCAGLA